MHVDRSRLGAMTYIAEGAEGRVHRLAAPPAGTGLAGPLAFKEIRADLGAADRAAVVRAMEHAVALRTAMNPADRTELDRVTTWPLALVRQRGTTVGTLLPLIPDDFFVRTNPPGGRPGRVVFEFAFLCSSDAYLQANGIDRSGADDPLIRLALAAQLSYVIALLHRHGIVYGDLSLRNVAIAVNPPRLLLLDCDPAAALSNTRRRHLHSPFFKPPECVDSTVLQDLATDVYKLGLCVLRGLVTGAGVTQLKDPRVLAGTLDQAGVDLVTRALAARPGDRPPAKALYQYLESTILAKAQPPVLQRATVNRAALLRGGDVVVTWSVTGATRIRITDTNGLALEIQDPDGHPNGYAVRPTASGNIVVEAVNDHGSASAVAGFVDLYELPQLDLSHVVLPRTDVPALAPVQVPSVLSALPPAPAVSRPAHPVPELAVPDLWSTARALQPATPTNPALGAPPGPPHTTEAFQRAHRDVNDRVLGVLFSALQTALTSARKLSPGTGKVANP